MRIAPHSEPINKDSNGFFSEPINHGNQSFVSEQLRVNDMTANVKKQGRKTMTIMIPLFQVKLKIMT